MSVPSCGASQAFSFLQYIDTLVSQKGLPYQEPAKPAIRSHLSSLLREFPCLHVKIEAFPHSHGRPSSLLLQVGGTIPILFLQVSYNTPIVIWLAEQYPFCAPLVFVVPSPFTIIKTAHPLVDRFGLVSCTHLRSWVYPTSNLVDLVRSLCAAFGQDPPLYSVNRPLHVPNGNTFMAVPSSASSSPANSTSLSTSASSLLGPGSLLQSPLSSTSLLGPGSLSQRWPSHGQAIPPMMQTILGETRPLLQRHHSLRSLSATSTTVSLLGPGKMMDVGRHMDHSQATPQSSGLSKHPGMLAQGQSPTTASFAHDGSLQLSISSSTSLLGPGKVFPSDDARNLQTQLLSPSPYGPRFSMQWQSPHSVSCLSTVTSSSSTSLLGNGTLSQWHPLHVHMGISTVHPLQTSEPGSITSASVVPTVQSQDMAVTCANGVGELLHTAVTSASHVQNAVDNQSSSTLTSNSTSLLSMSHSMSSVSTSAQQCVQFPSIFSNPLLYMKDQPSDRRQDLMNTLIGRLQCDIAEIRAVKEEDMFKLMDMEGLLKHRQALCKKGVDELEQQKENLEVQLQNILINTDFSETWLLANDKNNVEIFIDDIFEPCDVLSYQLLECTALDLAIEDELYCLDQAAQEGIVPMDSYLRLVRTLSREQFFQRALAVKIRAAQGQC